MFGAFPVTKLSDDKYAIIEIKPEVRLASTFCPLPVLLRDCRAHTIPNAQYNPATKSDIGIAALIGPLSSVPFNDIKPDNACAIKSKAGLSLISPLLPNPLTEALINFGLIDFKVS